MSGDSFSSQLHMFLDTICCHLSLQPCRRGAGLPLFGKSSAYPPARANSRIDFQFDKAAFHIKLLPFTIPYPVPFRILGDERKVCARAGWVS